MVTLHHGDCLDVLKTLPDNSIDSLVTDPPYGLSFMGRKWDYDVPSIEVWQECLRVLKPGGHLLAFAGTRTQHRMAVRIEDAGFEIRDMIAWVYGSGFPKSLDVSKAIDKAAGAEVKVGTAFKVAGEYGGRNLRNGESPGEAREALRHAPATDAAKQWHGWGTALKPALEPITVARKPLIGTVAENVLRYGTGGLNIDGCRVGTEDMSAQFDREWNQDGTFGNGKRASQGKQCPPGRWPANLIHDGSDEVMALFPQTMPSPSADRPIVRGERTAPIYGEQTNAAGTVGDGFGDSGSAARFFYCAKASKRDRDEGCDGLEAQNNMRVNAPRISEDAKHATQLRNHHPTVKPTELMRYLCRLVTPPGGTVLDPFMGSGSTGKAAVLEGFRFIGIEREAEYVRIASARIEHAHNQQNHPLHPD